MPAEQTRVCVHCGRSFSWRAKWAKDWVNVRYCSARCRRSTRDPRIEPTLRALLTSRGPSKTLCPSEVARALAPDHWRPLMEPVRQVARLMAWRDELVFRQRGQVVSPDALRGPVRLAQGPSFRGSGSKGPV